MKFKSERLIYRAYTKEDFIRFYSVFSNEKVMEYALIDRYNSEEELIPYFNQVISRDTEDIREAYEFAVFSREGSYIGFADIEIQSRNDSGGCGEIGYFILPEYWGCGYATEIGKWLIEFGFSQLSLHRITARCNGNNPKSERVMIKIGMIKEGEFRKERYKRGQWDNELHYSLLREEWTS